MGVLKHLFFLRTDGRTLSHTQVSTFTNMTNTSSVIKLKNPRLFRFVRPQTYEKKKKYNMRSSVSIVLFLYLPIGPFVHRRQIFEHLRFFVFNISSSVKILSVQVVGRLNITIILPPITVLGLSLGSDTSAKSDTVHDTVSLAKRDIFFPSSVQGLKKHDRQHAQKKRLTP